MQWAHGLEHIRHGSRRGNRESEVRRAETERWSSCQERAERQYGDRQCKPQRNRDVKIAERIAAHDGHRDRVDRRQSFEQADRP